MLPAMIGSTIQLGNRTQIEHRERQRNGVRQGEGRDHPEELPEGQRPEHQRAHKKEMIVPGEDVNHPVVEVIADRAADIHPHRPRHRFLHAHRPR